jgi:hypothetical protein
MTAERERERERERKELLARRNETNKDKKGKMS